MNKTVIKTFQISKEYKILKKNFQLFKNKTTIISGIIPSVFLKINIIKRFIFYVNYFNLYLKILKKNSKNVIFNNFNHKNKLSSYKQLIFFLTKNKKEFKLHLTFLLSHISKTCVIYVVGEKKCGINSISKIFSNYLIFKKIDYARTCSLYKAKIMKLPKFYLHKFINIYIWNNITIQSLPGVFGYKKIDTGSKLLISTFNKKINGKILDIGSGTGILSIALAKKNPLIKITLTDIYDAAIWCSKNNLIKNNLIGKVLFSDIYSHIKKRYDLIISNPPIHYNLKINLKILKKIIKNSKKHLKKKGELRIVISSFISLKYIINFNKINFKILLKNKSYTVIQITN
ncbi:methyltransferase [Buchnera aphidicola]|uniref:Ribosomal RNA small subunit methyltransferase C n=1 Tax=Buchnera aphidicola subsp. Cinara cedri (strain Cc) TaxID=372461 RepID=RSMC_BUCCC|nr:methyltransferase [Buchnera aphidicola]Q057M1.1 RecName: Full=Ribosomal RNA small subunit methyltransferase C; AltName: Full=16S rRNA m2G1207 methyltransferase; AltName: Full=rRNA (guanine-N(2)-)-methyltransferase RsmC [Buchnera aphidicola BCc]ABJ90678.1 16S RNA m2G1207 methylase [Buchnera aphidicola BCc]